MSEDWIRKRIDNAKQKAAVPDKVTDVLETAMRDQLQVGKLKPEELKALVKLMATAMSSQS